MNENELTKQFCVIDGYQKILPKDDPNTECCACDEADYDVEFIGIWSKETHPKDYPSREFKAQIKTSFQLILINSGAFNAFH